MAPLTSGNSPFPLPAPNGTILMMQDRNSPWEMDLNTSVTIIFGILGLIFQAGQICYGRRQMYVKPHDTAQACAYSFNVAAFAHVGMSLTGRL